MTLSRELLAFLTCSAVFLIFQCEADRLPPPTNLSYEWLDPFTVNVSWLKPTGLQDNTDISYEVQLWIEQKPKRTPQTYIVLTCMTKDMDSDGCKVIIQTVLSNQIGPSNASTPVTITAVSPVPRAEVVTDFRCFTYLDELKCSWKPVNPAHEMKFSYRICEASADKPLKPCDQLQSDSCNLKGRLYGEEICICVETEAGRMTFKPLYVLPLPKMNVTQNGDKLILSWTPPEVGRNCPTREYQVCYSQCGQTVCKNITTRDEQFTLAYDKRCRYTVKSRAMTGFFCPYIESDDTEVVIYGTDEPPDGTLTVVAIIIPVIVSVCVILSCYCFRRHRAIICPVIPDPSAIFKEMMMNGNKELKTPPGNLYTPVPEPVEPCKITLVPERICPLVPPQNS